MCLTEHIVSAESTRDQIAKLVQLTRHTLATHRPKIHMVQKYVVRLASRILINIKAKFQSQEFLQCANASIMLLYHCDLYSATGNINIVIFYNRTKAKYLQKNFGTQHGFTIFITIHIIGDSQYALYKKNYTNGIHGQGPVHKLRTCVSSCVRVCCDNLSRSRRSSTASFRKILRTELFVRSYR